MRIYLAGPMRGYPNDNKEAFIDAEIKWKEKGHQIYSPAHTSENVILRDAMMWDIACLYVVEGIALLYGWERSVGASLELALAQFLGLKIYDAITMEEIHPERTPWFGVAEMRSKSL